MATKQDAQPEVHPSVTVAQKMDHAALAQAMNWADKERRSTAATNDAERALSVLVQTAQDIASTAGDIASDAHGGSPIERERHAKRIERVNVALDKVRVSVAELAAA